MNISVTIMHHPSRAQRVPALVAACAPLVARPIVDPDPTGPPSPLRTAKKAWAAIADGATHHLVLQDDAVPAPGFAELLTAVVTARPRHGISLYSHWNSPQNSYLVRRAAAAGFAWASLSTHEWTPTQGFVLPAAHARDLAAFLADIPDSVRDDDEMITVFCRERGIPTVATIPHLVDHADAWTLTEHPGRFRATVYAARHRLAADHWVTETAPATLHDPRSWLVEFKDSRCLIRFVRPGTGEPAEHSYGWYWRDWVELIGLDPDTILKAFADSGHSPGLASAGASEVREVWAAAFLLGLDTARLPHGATPDAIRAGLVRDSVQTWLDSGWNGDPHPALVDLGVAAVESGRKYAG
jgi:hypothetical protein